MGGNGDCRGEGLRDVDDEALDWVVCLTSGMATAEQLDAFVAWRDADPDHAAALARARRLWTTVGIAMADVQDRRSGPRPLPISRVPYRSNAVTPQHVPNMPPSPVHGFVRRRLIRAGRGMAVAASVAAAVLLVQQWPFADVRSGADIRRVALADGSQAIMAPGTKMDVAIGASGERLVTLKTGEAVFDVARDTQRPFIVRSASGYTRVLGTAFSVRTINGVTRVLVARGRVEVGSGSERRSLAPGQEVVYGLTTMGPISAVDARSALGWTRGRLVLRNQRLSDVIAELDHFDGRKIVLLNHAAGMRRVDAFINLDQVDRWLVALEQAQALTITRLPGVIVLH